MIDFYFIARDNRVSAHFNNFLGNVVNDKQQKEAFKDQDYIVFCADITKQLHRPEITAHDYTTCGRQLGDEPKTSKMKLGCGNT